MDDRSIFNRPKSQLWLVTGITLLLYAYLTYRLGWPSKDQFLLTIEGFLTFNPDLIEPNLSGILIDVILFTGGLFFWLAFFAQFVLPLHNLQERRLAFMRLVAYTLGVHGPAIFIQNGEIKQRRNEQFRKGPGVLILDTASAAVLRTPVVFTRAVGPGTVFTRHNETIAGAVDLYRQSHFIGPHSNENPFEPRSEHETDEEYQARQERYWETRGLTRDGVEVIPNIIAIFRLKSKPGEGGTPFGYNPESVWRAIAREGIDSQAPADTKKRHKTWKWLPAYMAADLWREYLRKFTLDELFNFTATFEETVDTGRITAYEIITKCVRSRMTQPEVEKLDRIGRPTGRMVPSREFQILESQGIEVITVVVRNLRFPESVESQLVDQWKATWLERADREYKHINQTQSYEKHKGQEEALLQYATSASQLAGEKLITEAKTPDQAPDLSETLELLVTGTLDQCVQDPELHRHLTNEKTDLADLIEWIRKN